MTPKNHFKIFPIVILIFSFFQGYAQLPDYIVSESDVVPSTIISGVTEATTYCKVKNIGPGYYNATDVLVIYAYINQDTTSSSGTSFGMKYIDEVLMPGFSTSDIIFNNTVNLPADDYYMIFDVQIRNDELEANDTNNISYIPITILANITVENNEYGTVTGLNTSGYSKDEMVQLHAEPNVGCEFINWTEGGTEISTSQDIEFAATTNRTLTANFKRKDFTVEVSSNPVTGGQNNSSTTYPYGTVVTLEAIPKTGYGFVNWTRNDTIVSEDAEYSFTVVSSVSLVANFKKAYTITLSSDYYGTTSGSGLYFEGDTATITAVPDDGYKFVYWRDPSLTIHSKEAVYSFPVTQDMELIARFRNSFEIYIEKNDINLGSIKMGDEYISEGFFPYNSVLPLTAEPIEGYMFEKWTDAYTDTIVSTDNPFNMIVDADRYLIAHFVVQTYDIVLEASTGGTVSGGGTYDNNTYQTMIATPSEGYNFVNWTEGGTEVSTSRYYYFKVTSDRTLKANFAIKTYTIALEPTTGGTVSGNGTFEHGTSNTVTATPSEGYDFVNWTEGGTEVSTDVSYTFTVSADRTLQANFSPKPYTITLESTTGGSVSGGGTYDYGTSQTMVAAPSEGYDFVNWTEGGIEISTNASYTFTISADRTLKANYAIKTYTIALESTTGGAVSGNGTFDHGTSHTVTATPESDYNFISWTENGSVVSTDKSYTFTVNADRTLKANFDLKTYTVNFETTAGGTETGDGQYYLGTNATIIATPNEGYNFVNWTEGGTEVSTSISYTFAVNADRTLKANYAIKTFAITLETTTGGTASGGGTYDYGTSQTMVASPDEGYDFVNWTEGGIEVSTNASYTFTISADRTLRANYAIKTYTIALEPATGGTVSGNGTFEHGTSNTVIATPDEGYDFVNWTEGGTEVSTNTSYTFTVNADRTLKANYAIKIFAVTLETTTGGTASGGGTYDYGTSHTIVATPSEGYDFINWTEGGVEVSTNASYTFTVDAHRTLKANYAIKTYAIALEHTTGGTVSGNGTFDHGTSHMVTATPESDYNFISWTEDGNVVSTEMSYSFTVNSDRSLMANFDLKTYAVTFETATGGTESGDGQYYMGTSATITATPDEGYDFVNWTEGGTEVSTSTSYTFIVDAHRTLKANYAIKTYTIALEHTTGGTVSGNGTFDHGTSHMVTATPESDYNFISWTEDGNVVSTDMSYSFTVNSDRSLMANFDLKTYTVTFETTAGGTETGDGPYYMGTSAIITATPDEGYDFVNWTEGGTEISTNTSYTFTVDANRTLKANYAIKTFAITLETTTGGTVSGSGTYDYGTSHAIVATPGEGHYFVSWTENGVEVSENKTFTFQVTESRVFLANFEKLTNTVAVESKEHINVYPNPVKEYVYVEMEKLSTVIDDVQAVLYDISGKVYTIRKTSTDGNAIKFKIPDVKEGIYYIHLSTNSSKPVIKKIVVLKD